jgi:hypothetical protein
MNRDPISLAKATVVKNGDDEGGWGFVRVTIAVLEGEGDGCPASPEFNESETRKFRFEFELMVTDSALEIKPGELCCDYVAGHAEPDMTLSSGMAADVDAAHPIALGSKESCLLKRESVEISRTKLGKMVVFTAPQFAAHCSLSALSTRRQWKLWGYIYIPGLMKLENRTRF